ncbi:MAG: ATP-binding protein, partial [Kofleriaceae bacterium]
EKQDLEEQVRQAQKLESLGLLAGGVAHDFNNILAVIGSSIGMLADVVPASDADLVAEIERAVRRGASLTRQLLAFSRKQVIAPVVLDVNQVVEETRKMLRRMVGEDVKLSCSLDPELHHVLMDSGALVQVMMNLAVNARDAMPLGGSLTMTTRNDGDEVLLEVTDTGCGMPPSVVDRIFEPFFTTKGLGKGTGLGLSVVHGIVEQAGGRIAVRSEVGAGTTFSIHFPATRATATADACDASDYRGDELVLLVDDDIFVRRSAARALRTNGYTVLEATDGERALELIEEHGPAIGLLVTDVVMPGMDGRQLVEAARARRPTLKVLYTSGYTDDAVLLHGIQHEAVAFLEKPFHAHQLAGSVRRALDQPLERRA